MAKVKMKSNRSAKKRFKITATGKIKRWKAGGAHYNTKSLKEKEGSEKARPRPPELGRQGEGNVEGVLNLAEQFPPEPLSPFLISFCGYFFPPFLENRLHIHSLVNSSGRNLL